MTSRAEYNDEEWQLLYLAPWVVGVAVSLAEKGGTIRELMTVAGLSVTIRERFPDNELMGSLWVTPQGAHKSTMPIAGVDEGEIGGALLDRAIETCHKVMALLGERSTTKEAEPFRLLLGEVAVAVASTTRSGGVLGIGGVLVTPAERAAVDAIRAALDLEPMPGAAGDAPRDGASTPPSPDLIRGGPGIPSGSIDPS
jgi:hypothetical protein